VPKPCSRPLTPNPFETYRDPETGRWLVRYPANAVPVRPLPVMAETVSVASTEEEASNPFAMAETVPARRRWEKPARTKVA
jgi:hypothetical protein